MSQTAIDRENMKQYNVLQGGTAMAFSIRLTDEERALAESYAKMHSCSLAEAFKRALFERIEEEYDCTVFDEAYREYVEGGKVSRPIGEFWKEAGE